MSELARTVESFPTALRQEHTPHHKRDFSEKTKQLCNDCNGNDSKLSKVFKIIIVGDVSVGKTCIVSRFCHQIFNTGYKATIGVDFEIELFKILGVLFTLQIWDTAGQERFKCIAQSYYRGAHAIIIVFDMSSLLSLSHCETWLEEALEAGNMDEALIFLVGNKCDLLPSYARQNMEDIAKDVAKRLHAEYWPVSAKSGENVQQMFFRLAALIFDTSMENGSEHLENNNINIGTNLVSVKNNTKNKKKNFKCSNCNN